MPPHVRTTEVAARDGLQNEPAVIPTPDKIELLRLLAASGPAEIEATSFVSPKWIPQLGDAADVLLGLPQLPAAIQISALVPNEQGMRRLVDVNLQSLRLHARPALHKASVFAAASEGFSRKNTNGSIAEVVERFKPVVALAREHNLATRGYISCIIKCPFDGDIAPEQVARVTRMLVDIGIEEIDLGDTIGAAHPHHIAPLIAAVRAEIPANPAVMNTPTWSGLGAHPITLHLHDTFGRARECVAAALDAGVRSFDSSVAGLGGCPYAGTPERRAPGNISTETLVDAVERAGFDPRINRAALNTAAAFAARLVAASRGGGA